MAMRMPPLNPLRVFDVAARSTSFTEAAVELRVTQAAVSRQISALEAFYGVKLFDRDERSLTLTADGRRLHRHVGSAFDAIGMGTAELLRKRDPNVVTVQTHPSLIAQKLIPKLGSLLKENAMLELHFLHAVRPDEFTLEEADIVPNGARGFKFAQDVIRPAAAPRLVREEGSDTKRLLAQRPLIMTKFRHSDWTEWAQAAGIELGHSRFVHFESSLLAYQAAHAGSGVCIAQEFLVLDDITSKRLEFVSERRLERDSFYWCLVSPRRAMNRPLKATFDWLDSLRTDR
jgi:LysR family glycine cleavage system transcriptional activator